ncbi:alpha/beta hydrolase [Lactobacillus sp. YT155]|uniref:alpha/beta fold hydrolase n=1 Tax=Lactobacillus sp. YT155 TaxID=3060955 RepID=UPI00265EBAFC|nr:alpha/beta hydrolase [Lactobacillus sp. YT155]MDO1604732.1 alpha/beta hydrolase [Lactobacillus sp. YT155]
MKKVLVHGSGHKAVSWDETISYLDASEDVMCPDLSSILNGKEATYTNLYSVFIDYCNEIEGKIDLCGISLGGILALNYALDFPEKVKTLVLIGTPYKMPKAIFSIQNVIFKVLPKSVFKNMAFDKTDTFVLSNSIKDLDFSTEVQNIKCPTLIICGKKDRANLKSAQYLTENISDADLKIVENAGHIVNEENPKALAEILNHFY